MISKTREGARVISREADYLEYRQSGGPVVAGKQQLGSLTASQSSRGVMHPTVQSAIDDLASFVFTDINGVVMNTDGESPQGVQQVSQITITGTVEAPETLPGETPLTEVTIPILGFPFKYTVGDTAEQMATEVAKHIQTLVDTSTVFDFVQQSTETLNMIDIRFIDYQNHEFEDYTVNGITISVSTISKAKGGYGTWIKLGQKAEMFENATDPVTLHYYKRIE
ncbi:hypothetical protein [Yersinia phage MHG19]|nr:hypothetical protein [Yersinia phage MHG19]